jgi:pilus assembly protein CpaF
MPLPPRPKFNQNNEDDNKERPEEVQGSLPSRLPARPAAAPQPEPELAVTPAEEVYEEVYEEDLSNEYEPELEEEVDEEPEYEYEAPAAPIAEATPDVEEEGEYDEDYEDVDVEIKDTIDSFSEDVRENALRLLQKISDDESSEVLLNGPDNIVFKTNGIRYYANNISFPDTETYHKVINAVILPNTDTEDRIGTTEYLIEGQLELFDADYPSAPPLVARVHIIAPPAVKNAIVTIAKKAKRQFRTEDLLNSGSMNRQMAEFLKAIARGRVTTVFSGLSGSGKTTLLEAMSYDFDENDRVVVVEDTAELRLPLADVVALRSTSHKPGQKVDRVVTLEWLVQQANRMRPDRIIVGEVRGPEMAAFLTAANSGADGSMTTVHASSPAQTLDKIASLALNSETSKSLESINRDIANTVQIVVQTTLVDGRHIISNIDEISNTVTQGGRQISRQPIFEYDRNQNRFHAVGRPSESLQQFLAQRGVAVEPAWFNRGA